MKVLLTKVVRDARGLAGIEFAIVLPVLMLLLGGVADFALAFWSKGVLASSVAQGAQYAFLIGPKVSASSIQNIIGKRLTLPPADVAVTGPSCLCVSGVPATAVAMRCEQKCSDGTQPGTYLTISAQFTYVPILPFYSGLASTRLVEAATVRLK